MTNKKTTKRALFMSAMAMLLCFTMLLGTTYAWFTDSATSGSNVIKSGNLDLKLSYKPYGEENTTWAEVDSNTKLFGENALYEPGYTEAIWLKVENLGSLAFRYNIAINVASEKQGTNMNGEKFSLSDYLKVKYMTTTSTDMESNYYTTRESLDSFNFGGVANSGVASLNDDIAVIKNGVAFSATDATNGAYSSVYVLVVISMPTTVGNEANHNGTDIPQIDFSLTALATQVPHEKDSFGSSYDANTSLFLTDASNVLKAATDGSLNLEEDVILLDTPIYSNYTATEPTTINGNGNTITSEASSVDSFQWSNGGTIPAMSTIFSSADGAKVTVNDITFTGTMSAVMAGNYVDSKSNWFNTEFNNVNIIDAEVVSFSAGISPALVSYGNLTMNNCTLTGTKLSALDTAPMWPVYDMAVVNYSNTVLNDCKVGSLYMWNQAQVDVGDGTEIETITIRGNMNTTKYGLTISAGATVDCIDLSAITNKTKVNITIENGATVGSIVANGVTYASIEAWQQA